MIKRKKIIKNGIPYTAVTQRKRSVDKKMLGLGKWLLETVDEVYSRCEGAYLDTAVRDEVVRRLAEQWI